jgi:hypothetical protein
MDTDCTSDAYGHTDCTTTGGTKHGQIVSRYQIAEGSDGNVYTIQWYSARQAFGNGAAASTGSSQHFGTMLMPGEYKARFDKGRLKLLTTDKDGKPKEHTFLILSVRKKS